MADPVIAALQDRITLDPSPDPLPDRFPHRHGGTVVIRTRNGREFRATCKAPRGSGPRGVEWSDIEDKYRILVPRSGLPAERIEESLALIRDFGRAGSASALAGLLALPKR